MLSVRTTIINCFQNNSLCQNDTFHLSHANSYALPAAPDDQLMGNSESWGVRGLAAVGGGCVHMSFRGLEKLDGHPPEAGLSPERAPRRKSGRRNILRCGICITSRRINYRRGSTGKNLVEEILQSPACCSHGSHGSTNQK